MLNAGRFAEVFYAKKKISEYNQQLEKEHFVYTKMLFYLLEAYSLLN